jgi:hypothetical protein
MNLLSTQLPQISFYFSLSSKYVSTHAVSMFRDTALHSHETAGNIVILQILTITFFIKGSRDSVVGTATG